MLNVKTCEDSFLNQPRDRQQNTHASLVGRIAEPVCLSVNQQPFNHCWPPTRTGQNCSWKKCFKHCHKRYNWAQVVQIFEAIFQKYFTTSATSVKVVLSQSGWMVLLLLLLLTIYWQNNVINLRHTPWQLTCLPGYCFCLCVSEKLFRKAISVRIESPFVIGLPYSTVI